MRKLRGEQVDVWILDATKAKDLPDALSGEELAHLQKSSSPFSRENYKRSRNALRWILADYLGEEPKRIRLGYGAKGKPFIRLPKTKIQFNLSHSKNISVFAVSYCTVGIDIEKIEERTGIDKISAKYFSTVHAQMLKALPEKDRLPFFFKVWTMSEAFTKCVGESAFAIEKMREKITLASPEAKQAAIDSWKIFSTKIVPGYSSALAVEAAVPEVRVFKL